jgi:hypothetical protein
MKEVYTVIWVQSNFVVAENSIVWSGVPAISMIGLESRLQRGMSRTIVLGYRDCIEKLYELVSPSMYVRLSAVA